MRGVCIIIIDLVHVCARARVCVFFVCAEWRACVCTAVIRLYLLLLVNIIFTEKRRY